MVTKLMVRINLYFTEWSETLAHSLLAQIECQFRGINKTSSSDKNRGIYKSTANHLGSPDIYINFRDHQLNFLLIMTANLKYNQS